MKGIPPIPSFHFDFYLLDNASFEKAGFFNVSLTTHYTRPTKKHSVLHTHASTSTACGTVSNSHTIHTQQQKSSKSCWKCEVMHSKWNQKYRKQCAPTQRPDVWLSAALRLAEKQRQSKLCRTEIKQKNQHRIEGKKEEEGWQEARKENPKYCYDVSSRDTVSSITNFYWCWAKYQV